MAFKCCLLVLYLLPSTSLNGSNTRYGDMVIKCRAAKIPSQKRPRVRYSVKFAFCELFWSFTTRFSSQVFNINNAICAYFWMCSVMLKEGDLKKRG